MDLATLMGLLLALGMVFMGITVDFSPFGIDLSKIVFFIDPSSFLIVLGGTFGSVLASFPMVKIMRTGKVVARAFRKTPDEEMINTLTFIVDIAKIARQNILGIENVLETVENDYLRNGLRLVLDRVDRDLIVEILHSELHYLEKRRDEDIKILRTFASLGPAYGMIGTLIGLILLLQNLSDPASIGPAMALAIVTTLYGMLIANVFFTPWANKLDAQKGQDKVLHEMIRDGVLYIEKGERQEYIEQDLVNYLPVEMKQMYDEMKFASAREEG